MWAMTCLNQPIAIALIGTVGAIVGSVATVAASIANQWFQNRLTKKEDEPRRKLLLEMLNHPNYQWREFDTLSHVIGADEITTKRLLLEVGARASENGKPLWGLVSRNPLSDKQ